ncbi:glycoside hydrolase family 15 protein, partial [Streptomyces achromogenes]|uniref:glycoside hydrolase family 15 protein n=1 Tax=Streptomyces achromogenes TaxID=67255 RepID=UPI0033EACD58
SEAKILSGACRLCPADSSITPVRRSSTPPTVMPERADTGRDYDYRYAWIRDQCYAGIAVAGYGPHPLLDRAVRFVAGRVLEDGAALRPACTVDGRTLPGEHTLPLIGYPGGGDRAGNRAGSQFQLDAFGEALQLFAAAARHDALDERAAEAARLAVEAVTERWTEPDAGLCGCARNRGRNARTRRAARSRTPRTGA